MGDNEDVYASVNEEHGGDEEDSRSDAEESSEDVITERLCDVFKGKDPCPLYLLYEFARGYIQDEEDVKVLKQLALYLKYYIRDLNEKLERYKKMVKAKPNEKLKMLLEAIT